MADRLLSVEDVEFLLACYQEFFPVLVRSIYSSCGSQQIAQVLRHLLHQRISIRDLRTIFELLLSYCYSSSELPTVNQINYTSSLSLDDRSLGESYFFSSANPSAEFNPSGFQLFTKPLSTWSESERLATEFVKCGLSAQLTKQYLTDQKEYYSLAPKLEDALLKHLSQQSDRTHLPLLEHEQLSKILLAIHSKLAEFSPDATIPPIMTSTLDAALVLQDLITLDFPELTILHKQLIAPSTQIKVIAQISEQLTLDLLGNNEKNRWSAYVDWVSGILSKNR
jgi:type III secretory pathway component EscV